MAKNIFILLGNGFSIDLMNQLKMSDKINLSNLFAAGSDVLWPASDSPGFLSSKVSQVKIHKRDLT